MRVFAREIYESYCTQPEFKQHADDRAYFRKLYRGKPEKYIEHLEAHYESAMLNWDISLNEIVQLRAECAILRDKLVRKDDARRR